MFYGLCKIAESAFNNFDKKDFTESESKAIAKEISYLMSITYVIIGMSGKHSNFRNNLLTFPFFVITDGKEYNQDYLHKMNNHFTKRFNKVLNKIKNTTPEYYELYKIVWQNY